MTNAATATEIMSGKEPTEMPDFLLKPYDTGPSSIVAACTGPDDGLTAVKRPRSHLTAGPDSDIDYIDTAQEDPSERKSAVTKPTFAQLRNRYQQQVEQRNAKSASDENANKSLATRQRKLSTEAQTQSVSNATTINVVVSMVSREKAPTATETAQDNLNENIKENISPNDNRGGVSAEELALGVSASSTKEDLAGVSNWKLETDNAYGLSVSLYEKNFVTKEPAGSPIADCFGVVARGNSTALALADGVNWGEGARLAARSAVQGSLEYLDTAVFGQVVGGMASSTREVFVSLLRCFWSAHACILETGGALSTLTVAVILPLADEQRSGASVVCCCNVGDSLGYVYSQNHGVREFTQGSHDVNSMRDMRDALGALGPVDGNKPELGNLTLSMTIVEPGDIVFLTSDGISDNFDPVVGKFAEPFTTPPNSIGSEKPPTAQLAPRRQNKSASSIGVMTAKVQHKAEVQSVRATRTKISSSTSKANVQSRPKFLRSHTVIEASRMRITKEPILKYPISAAGLPLVTGPQRHALTLLRLEDLLSYGINGTLQPCTSARKLCHLLVDFARMITSAKRKMLEQRELFYKPVMAVSSPDAATGHSSGVVKREVEMTRLQQRAARKRVVDSQTFSLLPGKSKDKILPNTNPIMFRNSRKTRPCERRRCQSPAINRTFSEPTVFGNELLNEIKTISDDNFSNRNSLIRSPFQSNHLELVRGRRQTTKSRQIPIAIDKFI